MKIAIIGGGVFGAMTALKLGGLGQDVTLFERQADLLQGASFNNQNRLHLGFHYPRDALTAEQCILGFEPFKKLFADCILEGFDNAYFIAAQGSRTTPEDFIKFCDKMKLRYDRIDIDRFRPRVQDVSLGVLCDEVVYDSALVKDSVKRLLANSGVGVHVNHDVTSVKRVGEAFQLSFAGRADQTFDAVVNCCYGDINRLTRTLGHTIEERQFQYTTVAVVELDLPVQVGVTIMDGEFMTLLPFGKTGRYLLYHVNHTVIASEMALEMPPAWRDEKTSPFASLDKQAWYARTLAACRQYVPDLDKARLVGFLNGPRMILARATDTDSRPSFITPWEKGYLTVFSGKIDCSMWVADDVVKLMRGQGLLAG